MSRIAGGLLLVVAAVLAGYGSVQLRLWTVLRRVGISTPDELLDSARAGQVRAVAGRAAPGREGELASTVNGERCVWYRHTITHRPRTAKPKSRLRTALRRTERDHSRRPFAVAGRSAAVEVLPEGMRVDRPERGRDKVLPVKVTQPFPAGFAGAVRDSYLHREWIIRPGTPLVVLGQVTGRGDWVYLRRPRTGPGLVTTRNPDRLIGQSLTAAIAALAAAVFTAAVAAVALVGG